MSNCSDSTDKRGECGALVIDAAAVDRVRSALAGDTRTARTTAIFSALADPTRFRILDALSHEELCVCDLSAVCGVSQSGVSHQLRLLRDLGLVAYTRQGTRAVYRLADSHVSTLLAQGLEHADEPESVGVRDVHDRPEPSRSSARARAPKPVGDKGGAR